MAHRPARSSTRRARSRAAGRSRKAGSLPRSTCTCRSNSRGVGAAGAGVVAGLLVAPDAEAPLHRVQAVEAIAGHGLEGDRYAKGRGTFTGLGRGYELTLVEAEALEDAELSWEDARRNLVTRDIELNALVGRRFTVGSVECIGRRLAEPCSHLEKLTRPGIMRPLVHRAGLRADILVGGTITVGDAVTVSELGQRYRVAWIST